MARSTRAVRMFVAASTAASVVLTSSGCGPRALAAPVEAPGRTVDVSPARTEVACLDVTTSVPVEFTAAAQEWFTRRVQDAVSGPMSPATFYLRATDAKSYSAEAGLGRASLPALPAPPPAPAIPDNPYETSRKVELERQHAADLAAWQSRLDAARGHAAEEADKLRRMPLPRDSRGTDLLGCAVKAAELLRRDGDRTLFVASDLVPAGAQQSVTPDLRGVAVIVAFWCTDDAATCIARRDAFTAVLQNGGAAPVRVVDPQELG